MRKRGIIMSGDHPVKIMRGEKTVTRRTYGLEKINEQPYLWCDPFYGPDIGGWGFWQKYTGDVIYLKCPYGGVGDLLWVKETWAYSYHTENGLPILYKADSDILAQGNKWRPSIFMPRQASRITLEITEERAERLQEITHDDCLKEGIIPLAEYIGYVKDQYRILWDSLNGRRGYDWNFNPWVWVIGFKYLVGG